MTHAIGMTGEQVLKGMEEMLRLYPTSRVEIGTMAAGSLDCPEYSSQAINNVAVEVVGEELDYLALYYDSSQEAESAFSVTRDEAILILDIALLHYYHEEKS